MDLRLFRRDLVRLHFTMTVFVGLICAIMSCIILLCLLRWCRWERNHAQEVIEDNRINHLIRRGEGHMHA
jgi:H+/gluconate symporter-like permease